MFTQWSTTQQKKNDILKFAGKWMDLESIILSEVTQTQKGKYRIYPLISGFRHKTKKTSLQITIPKNLDNNEYPKRDIYRIYMGSSKKQDILSKL